MKSLEEALHYASIYICSNNNLRLSLAFPQIEHMQRKHGTQNQSKAQTYVVEIPS